MRVTLLSMGYAVQQGEVRLDHKQNKIHVVETEEIRMAEVNWN